MEILGMVLLLATGAVVGGLAWLVVIEARQPQRSRDIDLIVGAVVFLLAVLLLGRLSLPS